MTKIRIRYPDAVRYNREGLGKLPISFIAAAASTTSGASARRRRMPDARGRNEFRAVGRRGQHLRQAQCQRDVAGKPAADDQRDGRACARCRFGGANRGLARQLADMHFPAGYRWELAGDYRAQQESFRSLLAVLIVASALVFLLLAVQFKSLTLPLLIFLSQPISLASALFALWITGTQLNVSSFMGAILLIGLDVKNGILLIEYIGQLRRDGMPLEEALLVAGRTRFRPILMTSLTAIFGLLFLALGWARAPRCNSPSPSPLSAA